MPQGMEPKDAPITSRASLTSRSRGSQKILTFPKAENPNLRKQGYPNYRVSFFVYLLAIFGFFVYLLTETFFDPHRPQFSCISADAKNLHCGAESI